MNASCWIVAIAFYRSSMLRKFVFTLRWKMMSHMGANIIKGAAMGVGIVLKLYLVF
jgi:hypothetical protein